MSALNCEGKRVEKARYSLAMYSTEWPYTVFYFCDIHNWSTDIKGVNLQHVFLRAKIHKFQYKTEKTFFLLLLLHNSPTPVVYFQPYSVLLKLAARVIYWEGKSTADRPWPMKGKLAHLIVAIAEEGERRDWGTRCDEQIYSRYYLCLLEVKVMVITVLLSFEVLPFRSCQVKGNQSGRSEEKREIRKDK